MTRQHLPDLLSGSIVAPSDMPDLALLRPVIWPGRRAKLVGKSTRSTDKRRFFTSGRTRTERIHMASRMCWKCAIVIRTTALPTPPRTLMMLIAADKACYFRRRGQGVDSTLLQQYLAAGGRSPMTKARLSWTRFRCERSCTITSSRSRRRLRVHNFGLHKFRQYWPIFRAQANLVQLIRRRFVAAAHLPTLNDADFATGSSPPTRLWMVGLGDTTPDADRQAQR